MIVNSLSSAFGRLDTSKKTRGTSLIELSTLTKSSFWVSSWNLKKSR